ncbi:hypothetical protein ACFFIX_21130 [Metabacillus herbersteinensis]|uniref:Uncharacterized protein n=1 Tax=Metabacillus herbersteinensis TaxID=283816 RepID=A0ABV6GKF0_9BACI
MPLKQPEFMKSPFFVDEPCNWHLKPGAPEEIKEEFRLYMQALKDSNEPANITRNHIEYPYLQDED